MKATLEFKLPEEMNDFTIAFQADKYHRIVENLYNDVFRPIIKYSADEKEVAAFELVWERLNTYVQEILDDN